MGKLEGKVAFITGAARGQGRSHAVRLAQEGADIIAVDLLEQVGSVGYPLATQDDMDETVRLVEELTDEMWDDMIAVNLTGVFKTVRAALPHLKAGGDGGAIVLTSSTAGIKGMGNLAHYVAAKHGVVGLVKTLANELAPHMIRVNSVHPTSVDTMMIHNEQTYGLFRPDKPASEVTREDVGETFLSLNALPIEWVEPVDISNAILFLVSDDARYITGVQLPVDAGSVIK
jgi:NAD(P)-dependent dehydrogenase (short-subunit alcohol dehydrogenase family)